MNHDQRLKWSIQVAKSRIDIPYAATWIELSEQEQQSKIDEAARWLDDRLAAGLSIVEKK